MATNTYNPETKWFTRLSRSCAASDDVLYVDSLPTESTGIVILNKDSATEYETVLYSGKAGTGTDADPYRLTDCVRGLARSGSSLTAGTGKAHGKVSIGCADSHYFVSLIKAHLDSVQIMPSVSTYNSLPLSGNTQYDQRFVKDSQLWYYWSISATSGLISDWAALPIGSLPNATESVVGKTKLATLSDIGDRSPDGPLALQPKYTLKTADLYTPAKLTSGLDGLQSLASWQAITDGGFSITVDGGSPVQIGPINFSSATTASATGATSVGQLIQAALNAAILTNVPTVAFGQVHKNLVGAGTWAWTLSGSGTNEYYLRTAALGSPGITLNSGRSYTFSIGGAGYGHGPGVGPALGALPAGAWQYGDNDGLGFNTIYVRLADGTDPDTKADDYIYILSSVYTLTSGDNTSASAVSFLSAPASGTDISGAGAFYGLDMDSSSEAFQTAATLAGSSALEGYIPALKSTGQFDPAFIPTNTDDTKIAKTIIDAKGDLIVGSAADTPAILAVGAENAVLTVDPTQASGVKWVKRPVLGNFGLSDYYTTQIPMDRMTEGGGPTAVFTSSYVQGNNNSSSQNSVYTSDLSSYLGPSMIGAGAWADFIIEFPCYFDGGPKIDGRIGLASNLAVFSAAYADTANNFVGFAREGDSLGGTANNLWAVTLTGGVLTKTQVVTATGTNFNFVGRIRYTQGSVEFYIDNALVATHAANANIPAVNGSYLFGAGSREITSDGGNHGWNIMNPSISVLFSGMIS